MSYAAHTLSAEEYWNALVETGWLSAIPEDDHDDMRERVLAAHANDKNFTCYALAVTSFDMECIERVGPDEPNSYHGVLTQLGEDSYGAFAPSAIVDALDKKEGVATITFVHDEQTFAGELPYENEWFDPRIIDLINDALELSGEGVRFYPLPFSDHIARLVLIPEVVWRRANEANLIPAGDYFFDH